MYCVNTISTKRKLKNKMYTDWNDPQKTLHENEIKRLIDIVFENPLIERYGHKWCQNSDNEIVCKIVVWICGFEFWFEIPDDDNKVFLAGLQAEFAKCLKKAVINNEFKALSEENLRLIEEVEHYEEVEDNLSNELGRLHLELASYMRKFGVIKSSDIIDSDNDTDEKQKMVNDIAEQTIINCLKDNKKNGKPFCFLSQNVQQWIFENAKNPLLMAFDYSIDKLKFDYIDNQLFNPLRVSDISNKCIFTLPDDYEKQRANQQVKKGIDYDFRKLV